MNGYMTSQEAAEKWNITERQIQFLCKNGKIQGAVKMSRIWVIPEDAPKPIDGRRRARRKNDNKEVGAGE